MPLRRLGLLAGAFYLIHATHHLLQHQAQELLWACNVATLLLALGCALGLRWLIAVPTLWLCLGTPLWLLDLATGGELEPTSILTHVGSLAVGLAACRRIPWPRAAWAASVAALALLVLISRHLTRAAANINLAHAVWAGWEGYFGSYPIYFLALLLTACLVFLGVGRLIDRHLSRPDRAAALSAARGRPGSLHTAPPARDPPIGAP